MNEEKQLAATILIAGFQHETNTFAPSKATYASFERGEDFRRWHAATMCWRCAT